MKRDDLRALIRRVRTSLDQSLTAELAGVSHLIVVPDEVLLRLPFGALVTNAEGDAYRNLADLAARGATPDAADFGDYTKLAWLVGEYAITVLPSATSLRALRQIAWARAAAVEPFIGFADPLLKGAGARRGGAMVVARGANVLDELRGLDALPGTRDELQAVGRALGADAGQAIYVGARATKPQVFALDAAGRLGRARVLAFATHGLLAGEIAGLRQPRSC